MGMGQWDKSIFMKPNYEHLKFVFTWIDYNVTNPLSLSNFYAQSPKATLGVLHL